MRGSKRSHTGGGQARPLTPVVQLGPLDTKTLRAQQHLQRNQSRLSAANALRAAVIPAPSVHGARTNEFRKPDLQSGSDVPRPAKSPDTLNLFSPFDGATLEQGCFGPGDISG